MREFISSSAAPRVWIQIRSLRAPFVWSFHRSSCSELLVPCALPAEEGGESYTLFWTP